MAAGKPFAENCSGKSFYVSRSRKSFIIIINIMIIVNSSIAYSWNDRCGSYQDRLMDTLK